jgi:hypothetical protein
MSEAVPIFHTLSHGLEGLSADAAYVDVARFERDAYVEDRVHSALDALPEAEYADAIEFSHSVTPLTAKLASRTGRLVSSVGASRDIAELKTVTAADNIQSRPFSAPFALPGRKFNLIVFTDVLSVLADPEVDRLSEYALATLAPGGHVLLVHWLNDAGARISGDAAAERMISRAAPTFEPILRRRMPHYRLDVLERV